MEQLNLNKKSLTNMSPKGDNKNFNRLSEPINELFGLLR